MEDYDPTSLDSAARPDGAPAPPPADAIPTTPAQPAPPPAPAAPPGLGQASATNRLGPPPAPQANAPVAGYPNANPPNVTPSAPHPTGNDKGPNVLLILGAIFLVLVVVFGGAIFAFVALAGSDDETATETEPVVAEEPAETPEEPAEPVDEADEAEVVEEGDEAADLPDDDTDDADLPLGSFTDPVAEDFVELSVEDGAFEQFDGEIAPNGFDTFAIELSEGDQVVVSAQASDVANLDTVLRAVGPGDVQLDANDDAPASVGLPGERDSQVMFTALVDGTHLIEVLGFDVASTGAYILTVDRSGFIESTFEPGELEAEDQAVIALGPDQSEIILGQIANEGGVDSYMIDFEAGDEIVATVVATSGDLDSVVNLRDSDGDLVATNDDLPLAEEGQTDSFLDVLIPRTGAYTIEVHSFLGGTSGEYELVLERVGGDASNVPAVVDELPDLDTSIPVASGETVVIDDSLTDVALFEIILLDGDEVTIAVESANPEVFDPQVVLLFGIEDLAFNDDAIEDDVVADEFDSFVRLTTGNSGVHTIGIAGFNGSAGDFTLTISRN